MHLFNALVWIQPVMNSLGADHAYTEEQCDIALRLVRGLRGSIAQLQVKSAKLGRFGDRDADSRLDVIS